MNPNKMLLAVSLFICGVLSANNSAPSLEVDTRSIGTEALYLFEPITSGGDSIILSSPALSAGYSLTLPATDGVNGQFLQTDGSGVLTWASTSATLPDSAVVCDTGRSGNAHGGSSSGETRVRNFTNCTTTGSDITYNVRTSTTGDSFTINADGIYSLSYTDSGSSTSFWTGFTKNATGTDLTSDIYGLAVSKVLMISETYTNMAGNVAVTVRLSSGDVIRAQTDGDVNSSNPTVRFNITQVAKL